MANATFNDWDNNKADPRQPAPVHGKPTKVTAPDEVPVVRISIQAQADGGRNPKNITVETYVPQDMPTELLNEVSDKLQHVVKRYTLTNERENLRYHIKIAETDMKTIYQQIAKIEERRKSYDDEARTAGKRLVKQPAHEETSLAQLHDKLLANQVRIRAWVEELHEMEQAIGGGTNSKSDHQPRL